MNLAKEILINKSLPAGKLDEEFAFQKQISIFLNKERETIQKLFLVNITYLFLLKSPSSSSSPSPSYKPVSS